MCQLDASEVQCAAMRPAVLHCLLIVTAGFTLAEPAGTNTSGDMDETFARILRLEDRRSAGGGELRGYLDPSRPLAVRVRAALALGRIGAPVVTPYDLIEPLRDPAPELRRTNSVWMPVAFPNSSNIGRAQFSGQIE